MILILLCGLGFLFLGQHFLKRNDYRNIFLSSSLFLLGFSLFFEMFRLKFILPIQYQLIMLPLVQITICIGIFLFVRRAEKKTFESVMFESEARFKLAFSYSPIGIALVSLDGRWLKVNESLCKIIGYTESELLDIDFQTITYPKDLQKDLDMVKLLYNGTIKFYVIEKRYIRKDKKITWILLTATIVRNEEGKPLYYLSQIQDINKQKAEQQHLSYQANYDSLTGLINRNQLEKTVANMITSDHPSNHFSVFFLDLDHFKEINDSNGHDFGDKILHEVGGRLQKILLRKSDVAAGFGGDEFVLILIGMRDKSSAALFAKKIIAKLIEPIIIDNQIYSLNTSIGIAFYPENGLNYRTLLKNADFALYDAKAKGRNTFSFSWSEKN